MSTDTRGDSLPMTSSPRSRVAGHILDAVATPSGQPPSPTYLLPPLPYDVGALEPAISARSVQIHHTKHQQGYLDALNLLVAGTSYAQFTLEELIRATAADAAQISIFHNAAQAWNHAFYWNSLAPAGVSGPRSQLLEMINTSFGDLTTLKLALTALAKSHFGSGWVWLIQDGTNLRVTDTPDADTPLTTGMNPLLAIDVWEHAYYLDYQNRRAEYALAVVERLLNWEFAARNLTPG